MNYKILFFLALLLFSTLVLATSKSRTMKMSDWNHKVDATATPSHEKLPATGDPLIWFDDPSHSDHGFHPTNHDGDDDGKYLHFHFTRLERKRFRIWRCCLCKGLMAMAQAASLLYSFVHIVHY